MGFLDNHQYSAVTSIINNCCVDAKPVINDTYIETKLGALLDAIKLQKDFSEPGPIEAARAIRKKLKYGTVKEQFNALKILDLLVVNGGPKLESLYSDVKLIDRLQVILIGDNSKQIHMKIRKYAFGIMSQWDQEYHNEPEMQSLIILYERCLKNQRHNRKKSGGNIVPDFMNDEADMESYEMYFEDDDSSFNINKPKTNDELDRKYKIPKINYQKEKPKILDLIAKANVLSTNLLNTLNALPPGELSIHSIKANDSFDKCRSTRRIILRYLQLVNQEELLGPLLKCNDDLVAALKRYEELSVLRNGEQEQEEDYEDYDSLADLESDYGAATSTLSLDIEDSDDDDDYYARRSERYPPAETPSASEGSSMSGTRRPPPVPPKKSVLREQKVDKLQDSSKPIKSTLIVKRERKQEDDFNPFSDDNEVTPSAWN